MSCMCLCLCVWYTCFGFVFVYVSMLNTYWEGMYHENFGNRTDREHIHCDANFHRRTWNILVYIWKNRNQFSAKYKKIMSLNNRTVQCLLCASSFSFASFSPSHLWWIILRIERVYMCINKCIQMYSKRWSHRLKF